MDDASFGLSEPFRVFHQAGIRHLLPSTKPQPAPPQAGALNQGFSPDWNPVLARIPVKPLALITYLELGSDLSGTGDQERSALWKRLIGTMKLPKGSLGFLPFSFGEGKTMQFCLDAFLAHCESIAPGYLLVFGPVSCEPLLSFLAAKLPSGPACTLKECPSPLELMGMSPEQFDHFCGTLRAALLVY